MFLPSMLVPELDLPTVYMVYLMTLLAGGRLVICIQASHCVQKRTWFLRGVGSKRKSNEASGMFQQWLWLGKLSASGVTEMKRRSGRTRCDSFRQLRQGIPGGETEKGPRE